MCAVLFFVVLCAYVFLLSGVECVCSFCVERCVVCVFVCSCFV